MVNYKEGTIHHHRSNLAQCIVTEAGQQHRYAINGKFLKKAMHGDTVLVKVAENNTHAFVQKVVKRGTTTLTGKLTIHESGSYGFVKPWNVFFHKDFYVNIDDPLLQDNDVVEIEVTGWKAAQRNPSANITRKIYTVNPEQESIYSLDLPLKFEKVVLDELVDEPRVEMNGARVNLLNVNTFSLSDDKSIDALYSLEHSSNGYRIGIHIADVAHYIKPGKEIDKEAFSRGNSYRLGGTTVPMLPDALVYNSLSFQIGQPRYAVSLIINTDQQGNMRDYYFFKSIVSNKKDMSLAEGNATLRSVDALQHTQLNILRTLIKKLAKSHTKHYDIPVDLQWIRVNGAPQRVTQVDCQVKTLVAQLQALVNTFATEHLTNITKQLIYVQPKHINAERLNAVKNKIEQTGYEWKEEFSVAANTEEILTSGNELARETLLHSLAPAVYVTNRYALPDMEATVSVHSPLTKYADIITQRILLATLEGKPVYVGDLERVVEHLEQCGTKARSASRYLQMRYMNEYAKTVDYPLNATVLVRNERGAFVRTNIGITGWIRESYENKIVGENVTVLITKRSNEGIEFKIC